MNYSTVWDLLVAQEVSSKFHPPPVEIRRLHFNKSISIGVYTHTFFRRIFALDPSVSEVYNISYFFIVSKNGSAGSRASNGQYARLRLF